MSRRGSIAASAATVSLCIVAHADGGFAQSTSPAVEPALQDTRHGAGRWGVSVYGGATFPLTRGTGGASYNEYGAVGIATYGGWRFASRTDSFLSLIGQASLLSIVLVTDLRFAAYVEFVARRTFGIGTGLAGGATFFLGATQSIAHAGLPLRVALYLGARHAFSVSAEVEIDVVRLSPPTDTYYALGMLLGAGYAWR